MNRLSRSKRHARTFGSLAESRMRICLAVLALASLAPIGEVVWGGGASLRMMSQRGAISAANLYCTISFSRCATCAAMSGFRHSGFTTSFSWHSWPCPT